MISPDNLRNIIRISIDPLGWWSQEAEELLLMTAAHESRMGRYTKQTNGPALGLYQIEPATMIDSYENYLNYRPHLSSQIIKISGVSSPDCGQLQFNPIYSTILARLKYYRSPKSLPNPYDTWALAEYAKSIFNTKLGKSTPEKYFNAYRSAVLS